MASFLCKFFKPIFLLANENVVSIQIPIEELKKAQEALNTAKNILPCQVLSPDTPI
jgi:ribosomal protein L16/L10AE